MGVESAVYRFVPEGDNSDAAVASLVSAGAKRTDERHLVFRGSGSWIDIEVDVPPPSIGIRVAFSNPVAVANEIRGILSTLAASGAGDIVDPARKSRFKVGDPDKVDDLITAFGQRRDEFQKYFGSFEAAVSGSDVFRILRERSSGPPT